jgi:hypothetical protein
VRLAPWVGGEGHPGLKLGICGEDGGDPDSIEFFDMAGLDYVSCSPFRVPIARLAAAQSQRRPAKNIEYIDVAPLSTSPGAGPPRRGEQGIGELPDVWPLAVELPGGNK